MSIHQFDTDIAKEYGIESAILIGNIYFWIEKNKANEKHFYDGTFWTYNSIKAFNELFPYISESTIRRSLKSLEEKGLIKTGNYNKAGYDRTTWYSITEKGFCILNKSICSNQQMDLAKSANGFSQNDKPIPDINTDNKPNKKQDTAKTVEMFNTFYSQYPKKVDKTDALKVFTVLINKGVTLEYIMAKLDIYKKKIEKEKTEQKYIRGTARFLRTLEDYEDQSSFPKPSSSSTYKTVTDCPDCRVELNPYRICPKCGIEYDVMGKKL